MMNTLMLVLLTSTITGPAPESQPEGTAVLEVVDNHRAPVFPREVAPTALRANTLKVETCLACLAR